MPDRPDRTDALSELVDALRFFPSLFTHSGDAVGLYGPDGAVVLANDASRALIGEQFSAFHSGRNLAPADLARAEVHFKTALSGKSVEFEAVLTPHCGETINVLARFVPAIIDGTIVGVFGIARDITPWRRAEAGRDESRQQFGSLFDQHPDSIAMIDASGRYERLNAAAERLVGYSSGEVAGKSVGELYPPGAERDELDGRVLDILRAGTATRFERTFPRKDGTSSMVEGATVPIVVNQKVTGLFLLSHDVTDRALLAESLALAARRSQTLYRLASEIGADPDAQVASALAFGSKELGFESAFVVAGAGRAVTIERRSGKQLRVDAGDPVFRELLRETIGGPGLLEADDEALKARSLAAGEPRAFCRAFLGAPLHVENGRCGALGFSSGTATAPLTDFDREFVRALAELTAVSLERRNEEVRLQSLAHFDALTGLANRLLLGDRFGQAIATAQRRGDELAVYFIDIDKFKAINDTHGHHVGDEVLRAVARRLLQGCRESDTVARLGGDEFVVLRTAPAGVQPEALAARLRAELDAPCVIEGRSLDLSVGIGISVYPGDGLDQRALLERADAALYAAKACGAGSIRRFAGEMSAGALPAASLERRAKHEPKSGACGTPEETGD